MRFEYLLDPPDIRTAGYTSCVPGFLSCAYLEEEGDGINGKPYNFLYNSVLA